jgi:hypothetical protein
MPSELSYQRFSFVTHFGNWLFAMFFPIFPKCLLSALFGI